MSDAISAFGVTLERDGNPIAEITNIDGVGITRETIEVTSHGSTDGWKEYVPSLKDAEEVAIEGNFVFDDSDGQIGLQSDLDLGTLQSFVLTFPSSITAEWGFDAYVTAFKVGGFPVDGKLAFSAKLKISGEPDLSLTATTAASGIVLTGDQTSTLTLTPTFAGTTYEYAADGSGDNSVTVTVTAAGVITVNGSVVETTVPSSAISLTSGEITTITVIVQETGTVRKTYILRVSDGL